MQTADQLIEHAKANRKFIKCTENDVPVNLKNLRQGYNVILRDLSLNSKGV
jgi:hypothetical protein